MILNSDDIIITTTPNIEGKRIVKYLGIVTVGYSQGDHANMGDTLKIMIEQATELGANAIVGIRMIESNNPKYWGRIYGTAVIVEDELI
jgi:uncharacterized protein YbjQ (UPF0145 family)